MDKKKIFDIINRRCEPAGLNLIRSITRETADDALQGSIKTGHILAGAESIIVIGNYGGRMWEELQADIEADPGRYDDLNDPVDVFTSKAIEAAAAELIDVGVNALAVYPWRQEASGWLPFQSWGISAGFGCMGITGVVIHPEYGPWNSFRGAIIIDQKIPPDKDCGDFNPCRDCEAPCIDACPPGAVSKDGGCSVQKCLGARLFDERCETRCAAREACVYGHEHRFHRDEITYHSFTGIEKIRRMMGH